MTYCFLHLLYCGGEDYFYSSPQRAVEAAKKCVEMGFTAIKFDPAGPYTIYGGHQPSLKNIESSETFCMMIRDAIGPQADILFGWKYFFLIDPTYLQLKLILFLNQLYA